MSGHSGTLRRVIISTSKAPGAIGPYNQAVMVNSTLYLSGQIGIDPTTSQLVPGGTVPEARQALTNLGEVMKAANTTFNKVVKATVLLADINDFSAVNDVYKEFFTEKYPARAAFQVAALPKGARVEIEAIAIVGEVEDYTISDS